MAVYSSVWSCFAIMAVFGYYGHDVASYSLIIWRIVALYRLISPCIALYCTISHYITLYRTISPFLAVMDPNSFGLVISSVDRNQWTSPASELLFFWKHQSNYCSGKYVGNEIMMSSFHSKATETMEFVKVLWQNLVKELLTYPCPSAAVLENEWSLIKFPCKLTVRLRPLVALYLGKRLVFKL